MKKVSKPGIYHGYSARTYTEFVRTSRYLYIRGNNLAIDIYRPARHSTAVTEPYPAILQNRRYQRRGPGMDLDLIHDLVMRGYVVAVLDPRGAGASFGWRKGEWSREEALDGKEVVEWLAAQPYCSGEVGMWGESYMGGIQYLIAATRPPHLKAIVPTVATIDQFCRCPNGAVWTPPKPPRAIQKTLDMAGLTARPSQTVDEDPGGIMLAAAVREHEANVYTDQIWDPGRTFRNRYDPEIRNMNFIAQSAVTYQDDIKASGVAIYNIGGWFDAAPAQALAAWKMWGGKVIIGPWTHGTGGDLAKTEHLRWFDHHLKGIDNGVTDEPPICYYTFNAPAGEKWQFASQWPLPGQATTRYFFAAGPAGSSASINDGGLATSPPASFDSKDDYTVDYSIKVFEEDGVDKFVTNARCWDGNMEESTDAKSLTYTSPPLQENLRITGTPVLHLWASSTSTDGYFFAFLEEVEGQTGVSHYITSGAIKASCRAVSIKFPWTDIGIPYHRCYGVDARSWTPGEPVELVFDFYPTSYIFHRDNRIRVTIAGSLQSNFAGMREDLPPLISIYRDAARPSYLDLPLIPEAARQHFKHY